MSQKANNENEEKGTPTQKDEILRMLSARVENNDLNRFFDLSSDLFCIVGFDGYFKKINPSFGQTLGYTEQELLSQPFINFVVNEGVSTVKSEHESIQSGHFENQYKCKDGSIKWISWRSVSVPEERLIYATGRDITTEKDAWLLVKEQAARLKEQVMQTDKGLNYALLLQQAIFHDPATVNKIFPESFIFHSAKDLLSGDFYWFDRIGNKGFMACADCTGHGVSGAILSIMGVNKIHEIIAGAEFTPSKILDRLNQVICKALGKKFGEKKMNDGMDIALFSIDFETKMLDFAGANNPLWIVREGSLIEIKADKRGIGNLDQTLFTNSSFQLLKGDMIYTFSDGYSDQFGGTNGKKFMRKNFRVLLTKIADKDTDEQKQILQQTLSDWQGKQQQTDDICVIGIRA